MYTLLQLISGLYVLCFLTFMGAIPVSHFPFLLSLLLEVARMVYINPLYSFGNKSLTLLQDWITGFIANPAMLPDYFLLVCAMFHLLLLVLPYADSLRPTLSGLLFSSEYPLHRRLNPLARSAGLLLPPLLYLPLHALFHGCAEPLSQVFPHGDFLKPTGTAIFILSSLLYLRVCSGKTRRPIRHSPLEVDNLLLWLLVFFQFATSASNFLSLYLLLEAITFTLYPLITFHSYRRDHSRFLLWFFLANGFSSALLLLTAPMLYAATGTLDIPSSVALLLSSPQNAHSRWAILSLWTAIFLFKFGMFPFQRWVVEICRFGSPLTLPFYLTFTKFAYLSIFGNLLFPFLDLPLLKLTLASSFLATLALSSTILYFPSPTLAEYLSAISLFSSASVLLPLLGDAPIGATLAALYLFASSTTLVLLLRILFDLNYPGHLNYSLDSIPLALNLRSPSAPWLIAYFLHTLSALGLPPLAPFLVKFLIIRSLTAAPFGLFLLFSYVLCSLLFLAFAFRHLSGLLIELRSDGLPPYHFSRPLSPELKFSIALELILIFYILFRF